MVALLERSGHPALRVLAWLASDGFVAKAGGQIAPPASAGGQLAR